MRKGRECTQLSFLPDFEKTFFLTNAVIRVDRGVLISQGYRFKNSLEKASAPKT